MQRAMSNAALTDLYYFHKSGVFLFFPQNFYSNPNSSNPKVAEIESGTYLMCTYKLQQQIKNPTYPTYFN